MTAVEAAMAQLTAARSDLIEAGGTVKVTRPAKLSPTPVLGDDDQPTTPDAVKVYEGVGIVSDPSSARLSDRTSVDEAGVPNSRWLKVPHAADLLPGDLVEVLTSAFSPGLVGDRFVVQGEEERSYATYRRYIVRGNSWLAGP